MNEQRERAREARKKMGDLGWQSEDLGLDKSTPTAFIGYTDTRGVRKDSGYRKRGRGLPAQLPRVQKITVVLDQTPFYAEMRRPDRRPRRYQPARTALWPFPTSRRPRTASIMHIGVVTEGELSVERRGYGF